MINYYSSLIILLNIAKIILSSLVGVKLVDWTWSTGSHLFTPASMKRKLMGPMPFANWGRRN